MNRPLPRLGRPRRPTRQVAAMGFAAGVVVASIVSFFFDSKEGDNRRRMAYEAVIGTGRDLGGRLGHKAVGTAADLSAKAGEQPSEPMAGAGS
jgi:hypothetical protein